MKEPIMYVSIAKIIFTNTKKSQTRTGNRKGSGGSEATFPYYFTTLKERKKENNRVYCFVLLNLS
jgi:hypothetical protein